MLLALPMAVHPPTLDLSRADPAAAARSWFAHLAYPGQGSEVLKRRTDFEDAQARFQIWDFRGRHGLCRTKERFGKDIGRIDRRFFEARLDRGLVAVEACLAVAELHTTAQRVAITRAMAENRLPTYQDFETEMATFSEAMKLRPGLWKSRRTISVTGIGADGKDHVRNYKRRVVETYTPVVHLALGLMNAIDKDGEGPEDIQLRLRAMLLQPAEWVESAVERANRFRYQGPFCGDNAGLQPEAMMEVRLH